MLDRHVPLVAFLLLTASVPLLGGQVIGLDNLEAAAGLARPIK